jgi:hypothetical protein
MAESLLAFAQSVNVRACRVKNTPNLIFLCGGPQQSVRSSRYRSVRDYFFRQRKTNNPAIAPRVRLAEDISRWFDHGTFTDLLEVEEYVADLADLIILFVESAGSIAELGAFSALARVQPKVLAVVNETFKEPSFISDGPVRRLDEQGSSIFKYSWNPSTKRINHRDNLEVFKDLSEDICATLERRQRERGTNEHTLDLKSHGHAMLMVADLVDIVVAATLTDIQDCLKVLGRNVQRSTLQKYLFLLKNLQLIGEEQLDDSFYVSQGGGPYIAYGFMDGTKVKDRERAKYLIRSKLSGTRARVLRRHLNQLRAQPKLRQG